MPAHCLVQYPSGGQRVAECQRRISPLPRLLCRLRRRPHRTVRAHFQTHIEHSSISIPFIVSGKTYFNVLHMVCVPSPSGFVNNIITLESCRKTFASVTVIDPVSYDGLSTSLVNVTIFSTLGSFGKLTCPSYRRIVNFSRLVRRYNKAVNVYLPAFFNARFLSGSLNSNFMSNGYTSSLMLASGQSVNVTRIQLFNTRKVC